MSNADAKHDIDPLTRLAIRHGTDKWGSHFYTPLYHDLFSRLRDRPIRLLEIGVGGYQLATVGGASLAMWAEYFPHGQITGIDIAEKRLTLPPRVKLFRGSQDDPAFLKTVCDERGPFDIVIDDGSHMPKHVVASFEALFPAVADGGSYVIEDIQTAFLPAFGGSISDGGATLKLVQTLIECLNHAEIAVADRSRQFPAYAKQIKSLRAFHNLVVIEKGDNSEPSNFAYDLNNPHVSRAVQSIEQELRSAPTAEGLANLADLYRKAGQPAKAREVCDSGLAKWPANAMLLMAAHGAATQQNDVPACIHYLERMCQIEPDNAALQATLAKARTQLKR
jgi:hypothetical protein